MYDSCTPAALSGGSDRLNTRRGSHRERAPDDDDHALLSLYGRH